MRSLRHGTSFHWYSRRVKFGIPAHHWTLAAVATGPLGLWGETSSFSSWASAAISCPSRIPPQCLTSGLMRPIHDRDTSNTQLSQARQEHGHCRCRVSRSRRNRAIPAAGRLGPRPRSRRSRNNAGTDRVLLRPGRRPRRSGWMRGGAGYGRRSARTWCTGRSSSRRRVQEFARYCDHSSRGSSCATKRDAEGPFAGGVHHDHSGRRQAQAQEPRVRRDAAAGVRLKDYEDRYGLNPQARTTLMMRTRDQGKPPAGDTPSTKPAEAKPGSPLGILNTNTVKRFN